MTRRPSQVFAYMKLIKLILILSFLAPAAASAANPETGWEWHAEMALMGATRRVLPFWSSANKGGFLPSSPGGVLYGGASAFHDAAHGFRFSSGISLAWYSSSEAEIYMPLPGAVKSGRRGFIPEAYVSAGWRNVDLDIGIRTRRQEFGGLSVSGGDLTFTGNSLSFPGYALRSGWIKFPWTRGRLSLRFDFGDYMLCDNRFVKHALLHNQALYFRVALTRRISLTAGLEDWAQWGGTSPVYGRQPDSFIDYLKIMAGGNGGDDATASDQINALGNHLGRELIRLDFRFEALTLTLQHDIPFEDGSGLGFQNFPDGVNTLNLSFDRRDSWVSDLLVEFIYTMKQSGPRHDRPATEKELQRRPDKLRYVVGGMDNYFNNGEHRSGWTYNGRTIGLPLFTPVPADGDGVVKGVCNNRIIAWNFGAGGKICRRIPYMVKMTISRNYGTYGQAMRIFSMTPRQFSGAVELTVPDVLPSTSVSAGFYVDAGQLLPDTAGITLKISCGGKFRRRR